MDRIKYFDNPTQVKFYDADAEEWIGGIGYCEYIICGCCGDLIEIEEIYEYRSNINEPIIVYEDWINISEDIIGE